MEPSPTGIQHRRRAATSSTSGTSRRHDLCTSQVPYFSALTASGFDVDTRGGNQQDDYTSIGLRTLYKPMMDWSTSSDDAFEQGYDQADSMQADGDFAFNPNPSIDVGYVQPNFLAAPNYLDFGMGNGTFLELNSPPTVAPQETFVCPNPSQVPSTPTCQPLEAAFATPTIKSEPGTSESETDDSFSPCSLLPERESSVAYASVIKKRESSIFVGTQPSIRRSSRSASRRAKRKSTTRIQDSKYGIECDVIPKDKPYWCVTCKMGFDRPEHYYRHLKSTKHCAQCIKLGMAPEKSVELHKCEVPKCKAVVTRGDNLKPHYQKTHFYDVYKEKDGRKVQVKKRNIWVSVEDAVRLGKGHWDPRTDFGRKPIESCKNLKFENLKVEDMDEE